MNLNSKIKNRIKIIVIYLLIALLFFICAGDSLFKQTSTSSIVDSTYNTGELVKGDIVKQSFTTSSTELDAVNIVVSTYGKKSKSNILLSISDLNNQVLYSNEYDISSFKEGLNKITLDNPLEVDKNTDYLLSIEVLDGKSNHSFGLYYGDSVSAARGSIDASIEESQYLVVNDKKLEGTLCSSYTETKYYWFGPHYLLCVALGLIFIILVFVYDDSKEKKGIPTITTIVRDTYHKYQFLITQLVGRDFKTKYKRSVLGVFWSFLNPLLTMAVQFVIFSTLFKSSIENYPIYLLSGIVCYNFFNEVANMCLTSITGNESLIKKVYVPKYIYPVSRALSSCINFVFSLIPLLGVMLLTRTAITKAFPLIIFGIICLFVFSLGIGLLLATLMVFFRDTQFLWGVISMIWMYATPIIYPESILPSNILMFMKLNPLYHIVRFFRSILISGVSPDPRSYLLCIIASFVPLIIGLMVFKKNQDKFVLYL